jgi:hypothetical protein
LHKETAVSLYATAWLNSSPLTHAQLRGHVQFWSYTRIEWLRTAPYVSGWADRYRDGGLIVIGVHTPESSFEHDITNVEHAVKGLGLRYPIAIDNHYVISEAKSATLRRSISSTGGRIRRHLIGEDR